jgi:N-acetylmuramoyl-L-alanine amidase
MACTTHDIQVAVDAALKAKGRPSGPSAIPLKRKVEAAWKRFWPGRPFPRGYAPDVPSLGRQFRFMVASEECHLGWKPTGIVTARFLVAITPPGEKVPRPPWAPETVPVHGIRTPAFLVWHCTEDRLTGPQLFRYFRGNGLGVMTNIQPDGAIYDACQLRDYTWHVLGGFNMRAAGVELTGHDGGPWPASQMEALAWWTAYRAQQGGIPLRFASTERRILTHPSGILQHRWVPGNDHSDPGPTPPFPGPAVLAQALAWTRSAGPPADVKLRIANAVRRAPRSA